MLSFIRVAMITVSLHSNRTLLKTESNHAGHPTTTPGLYIHGVSTRVHAHTLTRSIKDTERLFLLKVMTPPLGL